MHLHQHLLLLHLHQHLLVLVLLMLVLLMLMLMLVLVQALTLVLLLLLVLMVLLRLWAKMKQKQLVRKLVPECGKALSTAIDGSHRQERYGRGIICCSLTSLRPWRSRDLTLLPAFGRARQRSDILRGELLLIDRSHYKESAVGDIVIK